jgi:PGF-CTERM protein
MNDSTYVAAAAAIVVLVAGLAGAMTVATQATTSVTIETNPTDPNDAEATHTVVFTPVESTLFGSTFDDIRVNYSIDQPTADVSNVGAGTIERIGIDRGGDDVGTRIDDPANVTEVTATSDGTDVLIRTNNQLTITTGDEIVVVLRPVQNPQNNGTASVEATVNTQSTAESATDPVTYEYNSAAVNFTDQATPGETVTVDDVSLSEDGYVVILNRSGRNPGEVRGATFVTAGQNQTVSVDIEPPVETQTELWAQIHLDTNDDRRFNYSSSGGTVDGPFETRDDNVMATDSATVWNDARTQTPDDGDDPETPSDDAPDITNYRATADGDEITVSFDSDETLADIEVDVRGPESATLTTDEFSGNQYEGYRATYDAGTDGEYTLELVEAEDGSGNDGADDGDYSDTATASGTSDNTSDNTTTATEDQRTDINDTATATDSQRTDTATATDDDTAGTETPSVTDDDGTTFDTATPTDEDGPGFGPVVALIALLASALLIYRRR